MNYKKIDPKKNDVVSIYHLLISGVSPRPIALVSSLDNNKNVNLAPFSFYNAFGANPPIIGFSPALSGRTGLPKDTLLNIRETEEFSVSVVTTDIVDQVSLSSCEFDRNVDEFVKSGLTKKKLDIINSPGVAESPFIMECKLLKIIELGNKPASGNLILGEVLMFHVKQSVLDDKGRIDLKKIDQVGRSGGPWYTEVKNSLFKIDKPKGIGVGFDKIPAFVLNSSLRGSELSKLANIQKIPSQKTEIDKIDFNYEEFILKLKDLINKNEINQAWNLIISWNNKNE